MKRFFQNPFGAMLWKELRENAVWAVVGALVLLAVNYQVIFDFAGNMSMRDGSPFKSVYNWASIGPEAVITVGVTAVVAAVLGFMQIFPEQRRDQRAFLLHRPISFATVFWCKTAAGLLLYFMTTGGLLLLLWYLLWLTVRRQIPVIPFDWRFLLGGWANILTGVPFYFAAMLCAMRPARWYGSRVLPLAGCVPLVLLSMLRPEFYQCFWPAVACSAVMAWGACSSFNGLGQYSAQSKSGRLALGLALLPGVMTMGVLFLLMLRVWGELQFPDTAKHRGVGEEAKITSMHYALTEKGEAVRILRSDPSSPGKIVSWDGRDIENEKENVSEFYDTYTVHDTWPFRHPSRYFFMVSSQRAPDGSYYYLYYMYGSASGKIYVLNFSGENAGYPLRKDYSWGQMQSEGDAAFTGRMLTSTTQNFLWFTDAVYLLDPGANSVRRIRWGSDVESVVAHAFYNRRKDKQLTGAEERPTLAQFSLGVVAHSGIEFYDRKGAKLFSVPREHNRHFYSTVLTQMNRAGDRYSILYTPNEDIPEVKRREMPFYLVSLDKAGKVIKRSTLPSLMRQASLSREMPARVSTRNQQGNIIANRPAWAASSTTNYLGLRTAELYGLGISLPLIALLGFCVFRLQGVLAYNVAPGLWVEQVTLNFPEFWTLLSLALLSALICCCVLWLLRRRSGLAKHSLAIWLTVVLLLGPAGLLLFFSVRGWPSRVPCRECGKLRAVNCNNCVNCRSPWPERPSASTDIFPLPPP